MPFELEIPADIKKLYPKWRIKIRENERLEPPHVTLLLKKQSWRWNLRDKKFMDKDPNPKEVPEELVEIIRNSLNELIKEWNSMYSHNPV